MKHKEKTDALCESFKNKLGRSEFQQMQYDLFDLIQTVQLPMLDAPSSTEEVKEALKDMPIDHAPGSDGFNGMFMKNVGR
jgi:hypothetical protein